MSALSSFCMKEISSRCLAIKWPKYWGTKKGQNIQISKFFLLRTSKNVLFFSCIFFDYAAHETSKEFWKYESWFSSEVSKLTLVQNKLNLSLKYWVMEAKVFFWICYDHKNWSKYHLTVVLPDWTLKKWALSNFAFQYC